MSHMNTRNVIQLNCKSNYVKIIFVYKSTKINLQEVNMYCNLDKKLFKLWRTLSLTWGSFLVRINNITYSKNLTRQVLLKFNDCMKLNYLVTTKYIHKIYDYENRSIRPYIK